MQAKYTNAILKEVVGKEKEEEEEEEEKEKKEEEEEVVVCKGTYKATKCNLSMF